MINAPYQQSTQEDFFGMIDLTISFPPIGKCPKERPIVISVADKKEVDKLANHFIRERVKLVVNKFCENKHQRFAYVATSQNKANLDAISELRNKLSAWGKNGFYGFLEKEILPVVDKLRTPNVDSKFYQYDNDTYTFLKLIVKDRSDKVASL